MAEYWSNNDRGYRIRLWLDQVGQDIAGNSSQVRVRLALLNTTTTFSGYSCSAYVDLNGQRLNWSGSPNMTGYNQTVWLIDQTITVGHNADGTKSFGFSAQFSGSGGWSPGTLTIGSGVFTLTTIPRTSSVSGQTTAVGSTMVITINRSSSGFTHTLRYGFGLKSDTIATNVGANYSWAVPENFAEEMPSSTSARGTIWCDTYSGSTKIGTSSYIFTVTVPDSMKPTLTSISLVDTNAKVASLLGTGNFLQILSNIQVSFNGARSPHGGSVIGYSAEIVGKGQSTTEDGGTFGIMKYNGSITIRASVTDSRGRTSNVVSVTANVLEYFSPIFNFKISRGGTTSSELIADRYARIAPLAVGTTQKNQMKISFKVAPVKTMVFANVTGTAIGTYPTVSKLDYGTANGKLDGTYAPDASFVVVGTIEDLFGKSEYQVTVSTESVVMAYDKDGRLAAGKIPELGPPGSIEAAGDVFARGIQLGNYSLTGITDFNTSLTAGVYQFNSTTANQPLGRSGWGHLDNYVVHGHTHNNRNTWLWQTATYTDGRIFTRRLINAATATPWAVPGIDQFYPIGSVFQSTNSANPATFMGGTWERFGNGRVLVGVDESDADFNTSEKMGGSKLLVGLRRVAASFGLSITNSYDGRVVVSNQNTTSSEVDVTSSNLQPYVTVYRWRRIA